MEESITLLTKIKEAFACEGQDVRAYSPLTLAYIDPAQTGHLHTARFLWKKLSLSYNGKVIW